MKHSKLTIFRKISQKEFITILSKDTGETKSKNEELAKTFDSFSSRMIDNVKVEFDISRQANVSTHLDPVLRAIEAIKYHPNILKIKDFMTDYTTQQKTYETLQNLYKKKACQENGVPVKIIKPHNDKFSYFTLHNFNNALFSSVSLSALKKAGIIPIHK